MEFDFEKFGFVYSTNRTTCYKYWVSRDENIKIVIYLNYIECPFCVDFFKNSMCVNDIGEIGEEMGKLQLGFLSSMKVG